MTTRKTLYILTILLLILACDSEKVLYEVKLPKPKVIETSFGKTSSFLKWNIKKTREEIFRYALSYGIVGGATLNAREIVSSHTLGTGFRIKGLKEGKKHWVKVQAVYTKFSGPWSNVIEGITGKPMPPADFKVKKNAKGEKWYVDVSWNDHPSNEKEKLTIKQYHVKCWDSANPATDVPLKYERSEKRYTASTKGTVLETSGKARYECSVQTETDKGIESDVIQSDVIEFHDIEQAVLSATSAPWGTVITFSKVAEHTYKLKSAYSGVRLDISKTPAEITATKPVRDVVVVAERTDYTGTAESDAIEFTRQAGDTFSFATKSDSQEFNTRGNTFTQAPTLVDDVGDDTRDFVYSISPSGSGATIDAGTGEVSITVAAVDKTFTITASKAQSEKYEGQSANYTLEVQKNTDTAAITKPALNATSAPWGTSVTFPKVAEHRYRLENDKGGAVSLADKGSSMTVTATKPVRDVVVVAERAGYTGSVDSDAISFTKQARETPRAPKILGGTNLSWKSSYTIASYNSRLYEYRIYPRVSGVSIRGSRISSTDARNNIKIQRRTKATSTHKASRWSSGSASIKFVTMLRGSVIEINGRDTDEIDNDMEVSGPIYLIIYDNEALNNRGLKEGTMWKGDEVDINEGSSRFYKRGIMSVTHTISHTAGYSGYYVAVISNLEESDWGITNKNDNFGEDTTKWSLSSILTELRSKNRITRTHNTSGEGNSLRITVEFEVLTAMP